MAEQPSPGTVDRQTTTLVVEARDLDTDERSRETRLVAAPRSTPEERELLERTATAIHPSARMRSFADGAATLLDRQHLIIAFYPDRVPARSGAGDPNPASDAGGGSGIQEALFA